MYPPNALASCRKVSTIRSPTDGQEGLVVFWTRAAAKKVARTKPGTVVVEATQEMFVEAIKKAHEIGVPWLYIGSDKVGVDFQRVTLAMVVGQYTFDGQHRHGKATEEGTENRPKLIKGVLPCQKSLFFGSNMSCPVPTRIERMRKVAQALNADFEIELRNPDEDEDE